MVTQSHKTNRMKVALVAIVKEEKFLLEWCRYHAALGFDKIYLYANDWMPDYALPNGVEVIAVAGQGVQMRTYQRFQEQFGKYFDYAMFLDADEYLYLVKWRNVKELIAQISNGKSIAINWLHFGNPDPSVSGVVRQFLYRDEKADRHVKTIMRLNAGNYMTNPHHGKLSAVSCEHRVVTGPFNFNGSIENAFIAHYYYQDIEHWQKKVARGRADSAVMRRDGERWMPDGAYSVFDNRLKLFYDNARKIS